MLNVVTTDRGVNTAIIECRFSAATITNFSNFIRIKMTANISTEVLIIR